MGVVGLDWRYDVKYVLKGEGYVDIELTKEEFKMLHNFLIASRIKNYLNELTNETQITSR